MGGGGDPVVSPWGVMGGEVTLGGGVEVGGGR